KLISGASEKDIAHSGLDNTMLAMGSSRHEDGDEVQPGLDLITAAYGNSIEKIFTTYRDDGLSLSRRQRKRRALQSLH
ncbi:GL15416, partial [Drosophila persimilis]